MGRKRNNKKLNKMILELVFAIIIIIIGYTSLGNEENTRYNEISFDLSSIPAYEQSPYVVLNNN